MKTRLARGGARPTATGALGLVAAILAASAAPCLAGGAEAVKPVALAPVVPGDLDTVPGHALEAVVPRAPAALHCVPGDRLKITFYERVGRPEEGRSEQVSSSELVERAELTGEYVVQLDGSVFLPLLGTVDLGGQALPEAQRTLAAVFKSATSRDAKVALSVAAREPVYVIGAVTSPGTYSYTEGMTVLHAIALSDGLEGKGAELSRSFEVIRERERLDKAMDNLKRLLARRAVLRSERDSNQPADTRGVEEIAGREGAATLMASVIGERQLLTASREAQRTALSGTIGSAEKELQSLRSRMEHIGLGLKDRAERLDVLNNLQSKGTLSAFNVYQARSDMAYVEEREDEVRGLLAQTELKLSQAQQDKMRLDVEAQVELARDLRDVDQQIAQEEMTITAAKRLLAIAGQPVERKSLSDRNLSFEIVRRTGIGPKQIAADEMTVLEAGDLLKISAPSATLPTGVN